MTHTKAGKRNVTKNDVLIRREAFKSLTSAVQENERVKANIVPPSCGGAMQLHHVAASGRF